MTKRISKVIFRVFSFSLLSVLIFSTGIVEKLTAKPLPQKDKEGSANNIFSAFATSKAFADAPSDGGPGPSSDGSGGPDGGPGPCDGCCGGSSDC